MALAAGERYLAGHIAADPDGRQVVVTSAGAYDPQANFGFTGAAPAANAVIVSIVAGNLPAGRYRVRGVVFQSGTPDANLLNGAIKKGGTTLANIPSTNAPSAFTEVECILDGATALNLTVGPSVGGAGAVYNGSIIAQRIV